MAIELLRVGPENRVDRVADAVFHVLDAGIIVCHVVHLKQLNLTNTMPQLNDGAVDVSYAPKLRGIWWCRRTGSACHLEFIPSVTG